MKLCDYGCGGEAHFQFKNGRWCCSNHYTKCPIQRKNHAIRIKKLYKDPKSIYNSISYKENHINSMKRKTGLNIEKIKKRYSTFTKEEKMRYNPNKANEKEIQVHCKNHECKNSKEKDGWFTPTYIQISERIRQLESNEGNGGSYFYCSQECKDTCPLYQLQNDPCKNNNLPYTLAEYQTCRNIVFERKNDLCEYCGEPATHIHHIRPQKLEPFFALDPDYCVACCEKCHYKKGHSGECSTGNLAKIVCSAESQKFLNQKMR